MTSKLNRIAIVGGGSAGWMSAATMVRALPDAEVVIIESPDHPVVGVGESTLGSIRDWTNWLGLDEDELIRGTDASIKLSIRFTNFETESSGSFHYPFGQVVLPENHDNGTSDWYLRKAMDPSLPVQDYARTYFPNMALVEANRVSRDARALDGFLYRRDTAFHFDAIKFGQWLKTGYCLPRGVELIQDSVEHVSTSDGAVTSLRLSRGGEVSADLYIDCTGWKGLLIGEALGVGMRPLRDLPNNRAIATRVPYVDKRSQLVPYTDCTGLKNGWVWNIPLWSRMGIGYVYSDAHTSHDGALSELEGYLAGLGVRDFDSLEFRPIEIGTGLRHEIWSSNVVAIGLSAGFIEPLESNGLFTVHQFLLKLATLVQRGDVNQWDRDCFNWAARRQFESFEEFVALHYALSRRDDSEYWRDVTEMSRASNLAASVGDYMFYADQRLVSKRFDPVAGMQCIATGMNRFPLSEIELLPIFEMHGVDPRHNAAAYDRAAAVQRARWDSAAASLPTLHEFLERIHR
jgi:tryptophan halogenase